ncbi:phosphotransferase [Lacrimispora sp.]|uniref:phosphotransferase n=1 Tax=Lacrimispora sp. TaxID=2719234 RepID=UPI002864AE2A|nr:phosphotransferase [Lacrimispora sp.]MDR7815083.1 phosphotransferase [Lacrimispora sp.]
MENSIISDLEESYGLTCNQITPVEGGWLNRKWKVSTDKCELLVKQFSNRRYSGDKLKLVESALQRQIILEKNGVPCPSVRLCGGHAIRLLNNETAYMVMEFHRGKVENPNTVTIMQMRSLGNACGLMKDNRMDIEKVYAFLEGYSQHLALTLPDMADALRLSWCIEVPWWIQPELFRANREKVVRFKNEMLWLTEHWFELDSLLCP